jgi:PAS domain S-box-containing protein
VRVNTTATRRPQPQWVGYAVAAGALGTALLLRWLLHPVLGAQVPFATTYGAVAVAVWFGGWRPAFVTAAAGYVAAWFFIVAPSQPAFTGTFLVATITGYALSCGLIVWLGEAMRRARRHAEQHAQKLEVEIGERARADAIRHQAEHALAEAARQQEVLYEFLKRRHEASSLQEIYDAALDTILSALRCDRASILLFDDQQVMRFVAWRGLSDEYRRAVDGHSPWQAEEANPEAFAESDISTAGLPDELKATILGEGIRAAAFIPLRNRGRLIGKFMTYFNAPHEFTPGEMTLALNIAGQLALGIERVRAEEQLRATEERVRIATETGKVGVWEWEIRANRITWTDSLYPIHGLQKGEFDGTMESFAKLVHPDDAEQISAAVQHSLATGEPYDATVRILTPAGEVRWLFTNAVVLKDERGPVRMIGAATDITSLKRTEEALQEAKQEAENANQAKDQFLAMLSHELRTPLTPVLATLNLWEMSEDLPSHLREGAVMMRRNVELEARIIDDLLDLTRISRGVLALVRERVDVHALIKLLLELTGSELTAKRIRVTEQLEAQRPFVDGDPARLQQVLWNILRNAINFTEQGGGITIRTFNDGDEVEVSVQDSGLGMSQETLSKLFTPFEQADRQRSRRYGGLGLGLAISHALVQLMGGTIHAHSPGLGRGSTFTVRLKTSDETISSETPPAVVAPERRQLHILLVEDHHDTAAALIRLLQLRGHKVTHAATVAAAIEAAAEHDLLICDIGLPDGTGYDVITHVRKRHSTPSIALTGFGMSADVDRALAAGFDAHLTKPVNFGRLEATMAELASRNGSGKPAPAGA